MLNYFLQKTNAIFKYKIDGWHWLQATLGRCVADGGQPTTCFVRGMHYVCDHLLNVLHCILCIRVLAGPLSRRVRDCCQGSWLPPSTYPPAQIDLEPPAAARATRPCDRNIDLHLQYAPRVSCLAAVNRTASWLSGVPMTYPWVSLPNSAAKDCAIFHVVSFPCSPKVCIQQRTCYICQQIANH